MQRNVALRCVHEKPENIKFDGTSLEIGGGVIAKVSSAVSLYAAAGYTSALGGKDRHSVQGNLGLRVTW